MLFLAGPMFMLTTFSPMLTTGLFTFTTLTLHDGRVASSDADADADWLF